MCGRYTITRQEGLIEQMEAILDPGVPNNPWWKARFNVAPTQDAPVVTLRDGKRTLEMMRWGLVPFWAGKDGAKPPLMINARVETVQQKPMFRDALARRRCLVPADGFYEWLKQGTGKKQTKQPMWIHPGSQRIIAFAGLWARARHRADSNAETGETHSFTIVTGPPNDLVAPIHDRMPVVLAREVWSAWLDPALPGEDALALLAIPPVADWRADPVSTRVNGTDHDDDACVAPITMPVPEPPKQGSLF